MDDFDISTLAESKNEWTARLVNILTPLVIQGFRSIFKDAVRLCSETQEKNKYLITFQRLISKIPNWNTQLIESEKNRICKLSNCSYIEDLVTCVHIIQLKIMSSVRVGNAQKRVDISIPKLDVFIHRVYIHVARKLYQNVFLFQQHIEPLQAQKNAREVELLVQQSIVNVVRENIPVEEILRAYISETKEDDVEEKITEEIRHEPIVEDVQPRPEPPAPLPLQLNAQNNADIATSDTSDKKTSIQFSPTTDIHEFSPSPHSPSGWSDSSQLSADDEKIHITDEPVALDIPELVPPSSPTPLHFPELQTIDLDELPF